MKTIETTDQLMSVLQLLSSPEETKKTLDAIRKETADLKATMGLYDTLTKINAHKEKIQKEQAQIETALSKKSAALKETENNLEKRKKDLEKAERDCEMRYNALQEDKKTFNTERQVLMDQIAKQTKELEVKEADLNRQMGWYKEQTKMLEDKEKKLKQLLG